MAGLVRGAAIALTALALTPTLASAQGSNWVADLIKRSGVGATISWVEPTDSDVKAGTVVGVQFGLAPRPGWGLTAGFGWYGADLFLETRARDARIGSMDFRPVMGGVSYTWVSGRVATSLSLNAGVSFNSATVSDEFRALFPGGTVEIDIKNSFVVRPSVEIEYAVHPKFALTGWAGYAYTKIDSSLITPEDRFDDEWNASNVSVSFGFVVYPFR